MRTSPSLRTSPPTRKEYSIDGGKTWITPKDGEDTVTFDDLEPGKTYEIISRKAGTDTANPSEPGKAVKVTTPESKTTPTKTTTNSNQRAPKTGDEALIAQWSALLLISVAGLFTVVKTRKKEQ